MTATLSRLVLSRLLIAIMGLTLGSAGTAFAQTEFTLLLKQGDGFDAQMKTAQALAAYRQAEKLEPQNAEVLHRIAKQLGEAVADAIGETAKKARATEALDYAKRAVAADEKNARSQISLAICYGLIAPFLDNKSKLAYSKLIKTHAERARELDPAFDLPCYVLGAWHYELANLNPLLAGIAKLIYGSLPPASNAEAVKFFQRAIALNPARCASFVGLGQAYARLGMRAEARTAIEKALNLPIRYRDDESTKAKGRRALDDL